MPKRASMRFIVSFIRVRVLRPRKSIFSRPADSTTLLSNCVTSISESLAVAIGTCSRMSEGVIMTPQACTPRLFIEPSMTLAWFIILAVVSLPWASSLRVCALSISSCLFFSLSRRSGSGSLNSFARLTSGTFFPSSFTSAGVKPNARAVSRMEFLAARVP